MPYYGGREGLKFSMSYLLLKLKESSAGTGEMLQQLGVTLQNAVLSLLGKGYPLERDVSG